MLLSSQNELQQCVFCNERKEYVVKYKGFSLSSVYQPIFDSQNQIIGFEALVRIKNPDQLSVRPDQFFESSTVSLEDKINVERLSRIIHIRNFANSCYRDLKLFLNVLPCAGEFFALEEVRINLLAKRLRSLRLLPEQIVMEVVEHEANDESCLKVAMQKLADAGFSIAIDDFGMNASNYHRVKMLQPNIIKIDRSLLLNYMDGNTKPLLDGVAIAHKAGAKIVIEGIETNEQLMAMRLLNVDFYQGYYLGTPSTIELISFDTACAL